MTHQSAKFSVFLLLAIAFATAGISLQAIPVTSATAQQQASPAAQPPATSSTPAAGRGPVFREPDAIDFDDRAGWTDIFDGKTLDGWDGNPDVWKVVDGSIVGEAPVQDPAAGRFKQTFLVWQGGEPADFELKLEIKLEGAGADSGILYRSVIAPLNAGRAGAPPPDQREAKWNLGGYQFDFSFNNAFTGYVVEVPGRGIIAFRGQVVRMEDGKRPRLLSTLGSKEELGGYFKINDWNQIHLIARGNTLIQMINGHVMTILIDDDRAKAKPKGLLGLQCAGFPSKISIRNIRLKTIP